MGSNKGYDLVGETFGTLTMIKNTGKIHPEKASLDSAKNEARKRYKCLARFEMEKEEGKQIADKKIARVSEVNRLRKMNGMMQQVSRICLIYSVRHME